MSDGLGGEKSPRTRAPSRKGLFAFELIFTIIRPLPNMTTSFKIGDTVKIEENEGTILSIFDSLSGGQRFIVRIKGTDTVGMYEESAFLFDVTKEP